MRNTRATLLLPTTTLPFPLSLPTHQHGEYYAITSQEERTFEENRRRCGERLGEAVGRAWREREAKGRAPSEEKMALVERHVARFKSANVREKSFRKAVKGDRQRPLLRDQL
jgi:hypothetical protein